MTFYPNLASTLLLIPLLLISYNYSWPQEVNPARQQSESDVEMFRKAQQDLRLLSEKDRQDLESAHKVEVQLWNILQRFPNSPLCEQVKAALIQAQEILAERNLNLAYFILEHSKLTDLDMKAAEFRLVKVIYECPKFSRMDEALLSLAKLYLKWGRREDAVKHLQKLACEYPGSRYASEAFEQLNKMGIGAEDSCSKLKPE